MNDDDVDVDALQDELLKWKARCAELVYSTVRITDASDIITEWEEDGADDPEPDYDNTDQGLGAEIEVLEEKVSGLKQAYEMERNSRLRAEEDLAKVREELAAARRLAGGEP